MEALDRLHLDERTLVVFMSDNGGYRYYGETHQNISSNGTLSGQKGTLWEGGHRVPAIARWTGRIKPGETDETVMGFDLFPTFLSLTANQLTISGLNLDGIDVSRLLLRREPLPDRTLFWRDGNEFAVRSGPWKLLHPGDQQFRLFDLYHDPEEKHDVDSLRTDQVRRMLNRFKAWEAEMGL
jgi:arylsulfatase A-like enzyme